MNYVDHFPLLKVGESPISLAIYLLISYTLTDSKSINQFKRIVFVQYSRFELGALPEMSSLAKTVAGAKPDVSSLRYFKMCLAGANARRVRVSLKQKVSEWRQCQICPSAASAWSND